MKSNKIVQLVALILICLVLFVLFASRNRSDDTVENTTTELVDPMDLVDVEIEIVDEAELGIEQGTVDDEYLRTTYNIDVDTPIETMTTLTNEMRAIRKESERLQDNNKDLANQVKLLLEMEQHLKSQLAGEIEATKEKSAIDQLETEQGLKGMIKNLEQQVQQLQINGLEVDSNPTASGYDIGDAGIPEGLGYDESGVQVDYDQIVWSNPSDHAVDPSTSELSMPDFSLKNNLPIPDVISEVVEEDVDTGVPAYTIPANATLMNSTAMTALIGRVPVDGSVIDPYPFKVLVGRTNLSSNGISIPNLTGIKMSGVARGDYTLSCITGEIYSMTFTFADGTISSYPETGLGESPIAWISDQYGVPCITGQRISNAVSFLSQQVGLATAIGFAQGAAEAQETTTESQSGGSSSSTTSVTGDPLRYAGATAVNEGLQVGSEWLQARQSDSFDVIYAPPETQLEIHFAQQINIDYDTAGRKVNHHANINQSYPIGLD